MAGILSYTDRLCIQIECGQCKDIVNEPIRLQCHHFFCRLCVISIYHAVVSNLMYEPHYVPIKCPKCGKSHFTNLNAIHQAPVDFGLRNIVDAMEGVKTRCQEHKKDLLLFCFDCENGKCLMCFLNGCRQHRVEILLEAAHRARSDFDAMKMSQQSIDEAMTEKHDQNKIVVTQLAEKLSRGGLQLIHQMEALNFHVMTEEVKAMKNVNERLAKRTLTTPVEKVKLSLDYARLSPSLSDQLFSALNTVAKNISNVIDKSLDEVNDLLESHGGSVSEPNREKPLIVNTQIVGVADETADMRVSRWVIDEQFAQTSNVSSASLVSNISSKTQAISDGNVRCINPVTPQTFGGCMVNSVTYNPNTANFIANTSIGSIKVSKATDVKDNMRTFFSGENVKAICVLSTSRWMVLIKNSVDIYDVDYGDAFVSAFPNPVVKSVFALPKPSRLKSEYDFSCIGATSGTANTRYVVSEVKSTHRLYVWSVARRAWRWEIPVRSVRSSKLAPNFKMCVAGERIYISIFSAGELQCLSLNGERLWMNTTCSRPNGLSVSEGKLYVCESERNISSIAVMCTETGKLKRIITTHSMTCPHMVAAGKGKIAVVQRYHRHNTIIAPVSVDLFDVSDTSMESWRSVPSASNF